MNEQTPKVVLGTLWAQAHPQVVDALGNAFDTYVFDLFNAGKSIGDLRGSVMNVLIMFVDMLDSLGPLVVDLESSDVKIQHVIVFNDSRASFDTKDHAELGVCGSFSDSHEPHEVVALVKHVVETCPCEIGRSRLALKIRARSDAFHRIEVNELNLAIVTLVAEGYSNEEIANKFHYSHQTIRNRLSDLLKNTGLSNRTELAVAWRRHEIERRLRPTSQ